jgi:hypothetical protein
MGLDFEEHAAIYNELNAALRAALAAPQQEPFGWFTDDHLTDKSATTYSKEVADRWVNKGWDVTPFYLHPAPQQFVLPERKTKIDPNWKPPTYADGWNTCLDVIERLNKGAKP